MSSSMDSDGKDQESELSLFGHARRRAISQNQNHSEYQSEHQSNYDDNSSDLFPSIPIPNKATRGTDTGNMFGSYTDSYSDDFLDGESGIPYTRNNNNYFNSDNLQSIDDTHSMYADSIHTNIVSHMMSSPEYKEAVNSNNSKFFLNDMYEKIIGENKDKTQHDHDSDGDDFETYNKKVWKEARIKSKIESLNNKRFMPGLSSLTPIRENDLKSRYITANEGSGTRKRVPKWFDKSSVAFRRQTSPLFNDRSAVNQNNASLSTHSNVTIPIDDDVDDDNLPIELQDYKANNVRVNTTDLHYKKNNSSSDTYIDPDLIDVDHDVVFAGNENLDFTFKRVRPRTEDEIQFERETMTEDKKKPWLGFFSINKKRYENKIQRKLKVRHLHQIALGGTLGVGLLLSSGKAFSIAGPLGCLLGFMISGSVVLATMLSFCEMVTLIPLAGGVSGISSRFVDDAFGFALGIGYWLSYTIGVPTEITAATIMLSFYPELNVPDRNTAGWISLFLLICVIVNLLDIRIYGEIEYFSTVVKLMMLLGLMIYMTILNSGASPPFHNKIGFKYWETSKSDYDNNLTYGPFRPTFDVSDLGTGALNGIGGSSGRFCAVFVASAIAAYAYVGTEIVLIAGGESRNPRAAIPSATKNIYWRILIFYVLAIFLVGINVYAGDPRLLRYFTPESVEETEDIVKLTDRIISLNGGDNCDSHMLEWAGFANGNQSPWVIALQSAGLCSFASVANAFLVYFALTAGSSQLYAASRTLYYMSIQGKVPRIFSICSRNGVPYASVLFTSLFGSLAFLSVNNNTALIFERLLSVCASTGLLVWGGMCLSFIRFYYGLKLRPDIISRDDDNYPYRSPFQPYLAYYGLVMATTIVIVVGFIVFFDASWSTAYFFSSYGSLFVVIICYVGYKFIRRTKVHRLDQVDLDSGRREIDRIIWEEEKNYSSNIWEVLEKLVHLIY